MSGSNVMMTDELGVFEFGDAHSTEERMKSRAEMNDDLALNLHSELVPGDMMKIALKFSERVDILENC